MGNTVTGSSLETRTMDYFDALPPAARAALAYARFDWACRAWLQRFDGKISAKDLAAWIMRRDAELSAKERRQVWGPNYPRLRGELPAPRQKPTQRRRQ